MSGQNRNKNAFDCPPRYGIGQEIRRFYSHRRHLNKILGETQKSLKDVEHLELFPLESEISDTVRLAREKLMRSPSMVVMGPARARLVNCLLGESILPLRDENYATPQVSAQPNSKISLNKGWRWLRLQHGIKRQIRLSFGSDIEVVEPSLFMDTNWEQIPPQILKRNDPLDLSTVMDIDLPHPFLEHGLQILVPPDFSEMPINGNHISKVSSQNSFDSKDQELFFTKRGSLLENIFPIILYALDHLDDCIDKIDINKIKTKMKQATAIQEENMPRQKSESDFFSINLRSNSFLSKLKNTKDGEHKIEDDKKSNSKFYINMEPTKSSDECQPMSKDSGVNFEDGLKIDNYETKNNFRSRGEEVDNFLGLNDENLLDLRQIYEIHPTAQVLFVLFANSSDSPKVLNEYSYSPKNGVDESFNNVLQNPSLYNETPVSSDSRRFKTEYYYGTTNTPSEGSSLTSHLSEYMRNFSPLECEKLHVVKENIESTPCISSSQSCQSIPNNDVSNFTQIPKASTDSLDSTLFAMDEDKYSLLDKQKIYMASLVEQLAQMIHPLSKHKFSGHWIIVKDTIKQRESDGEQSDIQEHGYKNVCFSDSSGFGVMEREEFMYTLVNFTKGCLQNYILEDCTNLSEIHNALLQQFILSSFDMAREMQIVPRRIQYVAEMEQHLYNKLADKFTGSEKNNELLLIIEKVLRDMKNQLETMDWAGPNCRGSKECLNNSVFYSIENASEEKLPIVKDTNDSTQLTDFSCSNADIFENITNNILKEYHLIESPSKESYLSATAEEVKENIPFNNLLDAPKSKNTVSFDYGLSSELKKKEITKINFEEKNLNNVIGATSNAEAPLENGFMLGNNLKLTKHLETAALGPVSKSQNKTNNSNSDVEINLNVEVLKGVDSTDSGNYSNDSTSNNSQCLKSSFKQASLDVQKIVLAKLSRNIGIQLVDYVDCLRDSYFGTLQRCLEALEEGQGMRSASEAVRRILLVTRSVDLQQCASFSFLNVLVDQIRRFFQRLSIGRNGATGNGYSSVSGTSCCVDSPKWRKQVAHNTLESLSANKLCRIISSQLKDRVRLSHEQFQSALQTLSEHHSVRLQQTEELKIAVRKRYAPRFARLYLESTSLVDLIKHGLPHLGKEIGRGQYGVVYAVKGPWGGRSPLAVKSVVPPDERHFNELAMEFFHTRNIPPHDRIVNLIGSVIDHTYGGGGGLPAVLLISEKMKWDLQCALAQANMNFVQRMQVAVDIVEGIRYLHSQGLVHRDIKLKNVLLNEDNRAKLTDLGFCIPEAMISGSVVGTPVHMAPELLMGLYDYSVDVYAFGILFWYVCAGDVRIPAAFEHFQNKEQLWTGVRRGLRPEKLQIFPDACWDLMRQCWSGDPNLRPLLGDIQPILEDVRDHPEKHVLGYVAE